ncbi:SGNH/GDSL hydrolase family protein [Anabaena lutea]|uniref:SGNH/GDSL hydrolase family protein n=1 Tax=Anabaena lutea FACHB-196 TaxID=2692881 RepID=A0ABR8FCC3_9NOST|nr:SGNH/GDSL hydrolase family protein [Anabaena lutea]MBD2567766.1 SGNH/GDSL hydrolase family protein [Anabaena lutea FACHB-196]
MKKQVIAAGFILFSFMLPLKASAANFSNFYVFGDSLSDTGNAFNFTQSLGNQVPVLPPNPPYFDGRFSNNKIWVDYLGDSLNLTPTPFTTLGSPPLNTTILNQSINFAVGGASSGLGNAVFPNVPLPGVLEQVALFTQPFLTTNQKLDPNALYAVWGGGNDYVFGAAPNTNQTVQNLSTAIDSLAKAGAKNIMVFNLPDLGKTPLALATQQSQNLTALTIDHNNKLAENLSLFKSNKSDLYLINVDVFSLFNQVVDNPGNFGFTNVTNSCVVGDFTNIYSVCNTNEQNDFLFFDSLHPTTNAHHLIADAALSAISHKSVPEPSAALGMLAFGALGATGVMKRKKKAINSTNQVLVGQSFHTKVES